MNTAVLPAVNHLQCSQQIFYSVKLCVPNCPCGKSCAVRYHAAREKSWQIYCAVKSNKYTQWSPEIGHQNYIQIYSIIEKKEKHGARSSECLLAFLQAVVGRETPRRREVRREDRAERRGWRPVEVFLTLLSSFPLIYFLYPEKSHWHDTSSRPLALALCRVDSSPRGFPGLWICQREQFSRKTCFTSAWKMFEWWCSHNRTRQIHNVWYLNVFTVTQTWYLTDFYLEAFSFVAQGRVFPKSGLEPSSAAAGEAFSSLFSFQERFVFMDSHGDAIQQDAKEKQD